MQKGMLKSVSNILSFNTAGFKKTDPSVLIILTHIIYLSQSTKVQLYSKKCTGRYFKGRDHDLYLKQGSLCTFKMILIKIYRKYF